MTGRRLADMLPASGSRGFAALAEAVRLLAVDGRVLVGTAMPSERELAAALGVSRTTVTRAYDRLREQGYVVSRQGAGSVLRLPVGAHRSGAGGTGPAVRRPRESVPGEDVDLTVAALPGHPDLETAFRTAVAELPRLLAGAAVAPLGLGELRSAVADRYARRGLPTSPDQVVVTTGAVAGIAAVAHALLSPGDRAVVEHPGYPGGINALRRAGARLAGWAVDGGGPDVTALEALARRSAPRLALLTPDFHNPTGLYLSDDERRAVASVLRHAGIVALVDETLVDTVLDDRVEAAPFAVHDGDAFLVGSASKWLWSGLRVGWVRVPRGEADRVVAARTGLDLGAPVLEQLVVARMLRSEETSGRVVRPLAGLAEARRDHLVGLIRERLPDWQFRVPSGGQTLWCRLPHEGATSLAEACAAAGVLLAPGSAFSVDGRGLDRFVRLPYTLDEATLTRAVAVVAEEWYRLSARRDRRAHVRGVVV